LGDRKGIHRFGDFSAPLDEALVHVVLVRNRKVTDGLRVRATRSWRPIGRSQAPLIKRCTRRFSIFLRRNENK
jgi:imidazoleglycerol phosphate dehydratase HisB